MSAVIAYVSSKFLLSLLFNVKVWTAEDCATLQIFSGSFASIISANSFKGKSYSIICCKASLLEFLWISGRNFELCWEAPCCDDQLPFAMHQGCSDFNRWCPEYFLYCNYGSSGNVLFSLMQPFSAAKFVMSVFPFFDASH